MKVVLPVWSIIMQDQPPLSMVQYTCRPLRHCRYTKTHDKPRIPSLFQIPPNPKVQFPVTAAVSQIQYSLSKSQSQFSHPPSLTSPEPSEANPPSLPAKQLNQHI
ncbi:hypothetical protein L873DRAFT_154678 [Choiromyces venosus 120613-1]|uniref:Uncharacterized protein n=1 Tax=Choiromyces venosus 120613-1 TaxID=1336337 RepID=A0A3N4J2U3_9PEZI|nr:hypothetical protein L873DRAFT_154678 [Choiromyces venosus 120613-1]